MVQLKVEQMTIIIVSTKHCFVSALQHWYIPSPCANTNLKSRNSHLRQMEWEKPNYLNYSTKQSVKSLIPEQEKVSLTSPHHSKHMDQYTSDQDLQPQKYHGVFYQYN
jgi:hypothetical protein